MTTLWPRSPGGQYGSPWTRDWPRRQRASRGVDHDSARERSSIVTGAMIGPELRTKASARRRNQLNHVIYSARGTDVINRCQRLFKIVGSAAGPFSSASSRAASWRNCSNLWRGRLCKSLNADTASIAFVIEMSTSNVASFGNRSTASFKQIAGAGSRTSRITRSPCSSKSSANALSRFSL